MSVTQRIKQGFLRTPMVQKIVLLSSALLMISPILPWFDSKNSSNIGETYIGVSGPLFLVGILVMTFGAISFFNLFLPLMGKNFFKLRKKSGLVSMLLAIQSLFLIGIANSVFFHPSFGSNISNKGTRFGMFVSVVAIGLMVGAGYLTHRKEKNGEIEDIEDIMTNEEVTPSPVQAVPRPVSSARTYEPAPRPNSYSVPVNNSSSPSSVPSDAYGGGDPLLLDPKTRYKMMQAQARRAQSQSQSKNAQNNLWGGVKEREEY